MQLLPMCLAHCGPEHIWIGKLGHNCLQDGSSSIRFPFTVAAILFRGEMRFKVYKFHNRFVAGVYMCGTRIIIASILKYDVVVMGKSLLLNTFNFYHMDGLFIW